MLDGIVDYEKNAQDREQHGRRTKLFAAVVIAVMDDYIQDVKTYGLSDTITRCRAWFFSNDGKEVLTCAGISVSDRTLNGMIEFITKGIRSSIALVKESTRDETV